MLPSPRWERGTAWSGAAALAAVLLVFAQRYDYERDELYFRMLRPAWGYVDQPPLVPALARWSTHLADQPWALRLPAVLTLAASVLVVSLLTRELGGGRLAQQVAVWSYAGSSAAMVFGHVLLTATFDLLTWPLVCLYVARALLRGDGRWWLAAGLVAGLASYDKLLVSWLLAGIVLGLVVLGPRTVLATRWPWLGAAVTLVLSAPNLAYQVAHGWPQLEMGAALAENNAADVRTFLPVFLVVVLGPPLVPVWGAGLVALLRRPAWRPVRCLAAAFVVVVVLTFVSGTQPHYPTGLLVVLLAAGAVPSADLVARSPGWRRLLVAGIALNTAVSVVVGLPVLPLRVLGRTPVPGMNLTAADQVGWRTYVAQVAAVADTLTADQRRRAVVLASNYGEAGAVARYGPELGLPAVFSGQNALHDQGPPPASADVVLLVGDALEEVRDLFGSCTVRTHLDNGVGVDNEEQGVPVALCLDPRGGWPRVWPRLRHLD